MVTTDIVRTNRLLNKINDDMEQLLSPFVQCENNELTRKNIADIVDRYMHTLRLYEYKVVCDASNNVPYDGRMVVSVALRTHTSVSIHNVNGIINGLIPFEQLGDELNEAYTRAMKTLEQEQS